MAESTIITGQFVRISQVPASLGERILARIIDYFLLFIYILATSYILGKLNIHTFSVSDSVLRQLLAIMKSYRAVYLDHSFQTLKMLDGLFTG